MYTAYTNKVAIVYLPAHCSHFTQPVDITCFGPVKQAYHKELFKYALQPNSVGRKRSLFIQAYVKARSAINRSNICAGFEASGIYPQSRERVLASKFIQASEPSPAPLSSKSHQNQPVLEPQLGSMTGRAERAELRSLKRRLEEV